LECPDDNALTGWLRRALPDAEQRSIATHIRSCEACRGLLDTLATAFAEDAPARHIGRYRVLRPIGSGGFGVVYLAWDPQLDRQIALKVLRPLDRDADGLAADLLREAKAMAKLSHPNVTAVFDVAALDGQVAIAMELIDGGNAREWLAETPRTPAEVYRVFLSAAAGLAAAHAAGLVHRDFKPENVLVGRDGRVCVTDFGLARPQAAKGARSGTPRYMAPELRQSAPVDARADQYGFAVALKEALGAQTPRALERALAERPADRYPDMKALIAALAPDRRWRPLKVAATLAIALTPIAAGYAWSVSRDALCSGGPARVRAVWPRALEDELRAAWGEGFSSVERSLDVWLQRWSARYTEACEATRIRQEQPEDVLAARMSCLDRLHDQARATIEALRRAPPEERAAAARLPASLEPPDRCMDAGPLLREERPAEVQRGAVRQLRFELEQARAERNLGHLEAAAQLADRARARAEGLGYAPLLAEVSLFEGEGQLMLGEQSAARASLLSAVHEATKGRSDRTAADAWIALLRLDGLVTSEELARPWREAARAAAERVRGDVVIEGRLQNALGLSLAAGGRLTEALERQRAALEAMARAYGSDAPQLGPQRHKIAELLLGLGAYSSAAREALASQAEISRAFGAVHPLVALPLSVLGECACARGEWSSCLELSEQAASLRATARTPPDHPTFIPKHLAAAMALRGLGRGPEAEARFDLAEALARKASEVWLGRVLAERGGLERTAQAVALLTAAEGPTHPDTWYARRAHAQALLDAGKTTEAEREFGALATQAAAPRVAAALLGQARALELLGNGDAARVALERAAEAAGDEDPLVAAAAKGSPRPASPK
jgi:tetratricopeptide (TPR) repeat protein